VTPHVDHSTLPGYRPSHILADGCDLCDAIVEAAPFSLGYISDGDFMRLYRSHRESMGQQWVGERREVSRNDAAIWRLIEIHRIIQLRLDRLTKKGDTQ
jgi:hypothetical protein